MRLLFMGTPDFSVPTLEALIESEHKVVGVVSQPDRPKGRSKQLQATPVKEVALRHGIPVYQPVRVREEGFDAIIEALDVDLAIVIAFGQILPQSFLELPKYGCINIHASLLPDYRGAGPIQRSIINGNTVTGVTTMMMDAGMDTGDMLLKEELVIESDDTGGSLFEKLSCLGGPLILKTIDALESGTLQRIPQDNDLATYAPPLNKQLGNIDWKLSATAIECLIRGLNPWPSAYSYINGKMIKMWDAEVVDINEEGHPGEILQINKAGFVVACGKGGLQMNQLQLQGRKRMTAGEFLRGYPLEVGMLLSQVPND